MNKTIEVQVAQKHNNDTKQNQKLEYLKPQMEVYEMEVEGAILSASNTANGYEWGGTESI